MRQNDAPCPYCSTMIGGRLPSVKQHKNGNESYYSFSIYFRLDPSDAVTGFLALVPAPRLNLLQHTTAGSGQARGHPNSKACNSCRVPFNNSLLLILHETISSLSSEKPSPLAPSLQIISGKLHALWTILHVGPENSIPLFACSRSSSLSQPFTPYAALSFASLLVAPITTSSFSRPAVTTCFHADHTPEECAFP